MSVAKQNYQYIDLLKAVAILFVIVYHFNNVQVDFLQQNTYASYINYYFTSGLSTCVPLFFFLNGALLLNKSTLNLKKHVYKIINIGLLIVFWGVLTMLILSFLRDEKLNVKEVIGGALTLKQEWTNHLWYLVALLVIYVFFPLLFAAFKENRKSLYLFLSFVMLFTFGNTLLSMGIGMLSYFLDRPVDPKIIIYHSKNLFGEFNPFRGIYGYSLGYFILGGLIFQYRGNLNNKKYKLIAAVSIPLSMFLLTIYGVMASVQVNEIWDIVWYGYDTVFTLVSVVCFFVLSLGYQHKGIVGKTIKIFGDNTLGIYLVHVLIGETFKHYLFEHQYSTLFVSSILYALAVLTCSLLIVLLVKRIPFVRRVVSI